MEGSLTQRASGSGEAGPSALVVILPDGVIDDSGAKVAAALGREGTSVRALFYEQLSPATVSDMYSASFLRSHRRAANSWVAYSQFAVGPCVILVVESADVGNDLHSSLAAIKGSSRSPSTGTLRGQSSHTAKGFSLVHTADSDAEFIHQFGLIADNQLADDILLRGRDRQVDWASVQCLASRSILNADSEPGQYIDRLRALAGILLICDRRLQPRDSDELPALRNAYEKGRLATSFDEMVGPISLAWDPPTPSGRLKAASHFHDRSMLRDVAILIGRHRLDSGTASLCVDVLQRNGLVCSAIERQRALSALIFND